MTEIGEQAAGLIAGVVGIAVIDEIARDVPPQSLRQRMMMRIVAGIEMGDANLRRDIRPADRGECGVKLRMRGVAEPVIVGVDREGRILRIQDIAGLHQ